jgi:hypothetical protein
MLPHILYDSMKVEGKLKPQKGVAQMQRRIIEQVEEILKGAVTAEELAEIEKIIQEAKGRIPAENELGFWEGKTTCWEMCNCPQSLRQECPSYKNREIPCWEIEGTYCKLDDYGATGRDTSICQICRVYKRWGNGNPIKITLLGQGFSPTLTHQTRVSGSRGA